MTDPQKKKKSDFIPEYHNITATVPHLQAEIIEDLLRSYISTYERQRLPPATASSPEVDYDEFF